MVMNRCVVEVLDSYFFFSLARVVDTWIWRVGGRRKIVTGCLSAVIVRSGRIQASIACFTGLHAAASRRRRRKWTSTHRNIRLEGLWIWRVEGVGSAGVILERVVASVLIHF